MLIGDGSLRKIAEFQEQFVWWERFASLRLKKDYYTDAVISLDKTLSRRHPRLNQGQRSQIIAVAINLFKVKETACGVVKDEVDSEAIGRLLRRHRGSANSQCSRSRITGRA